MSIQSALVVAAGIAIASQGGVQIGELAPGFTLRNTDADDEQMTLSRFRGKTVV